MFAHPLAGRHDRGRLRLDSGPGHVEQLVETHGACLQRVRWRQDATLHFAAHDRRQRLGRTASGNERNLTFQTEIFDANLACDMRDRAKVAYPEGRAFELIWPLDRLLDIDRLSERVDKARDNDEVAA